MQIVDVNRIEGCRFPARRRSQNLVGGTSPLTAQTFRLGVVTLDPDGGQVPWHNHAQEEVYFLLEGIGEMCVGDEKQTLAAGQAVYIPSSVFH